MKFSYKILLCTIIIIAVAFGFSGYFFVNFVFETALNREVEQAMDESSILQFAFETAALNVPSKYDVLPDRTVEQIGSRLENSGQGEGRLLRLSDENGETLYASNGFTEDLSLLERIDNETRAYQVIPLGDRYYIQMGAQVNALDRILFLETMRDVTVVFEEREQGFSMYRKVTVLMLILSSAIMSLVSIWLTRPIRLLTKATRKMAEGEYSYRAEQISHDELGRLTVDYNKMAAALEENIHKLEEEIRSREDFIAAFAHELKTPLTAIIGYADLLRSRKLDEEKHFLSASYIYSEGKRLEAMSLRLLDIIVTKRDVIRPQSVPVDRLFSYLRDMFAENGYLFHYRYEPGMVYAEINLIKSVLLNLVDNACKASEPGSVIELGGRRVEKPAGYCFEVADYGEGIPREELKKITEAFYMVDKSRSRSRNGAGLGLALCVEILKLHHSELQIESVVGEGTRIRFVLPDEVVETVKQGR